MMASYVSISSTAFVVWVFMFSHQLYVGCLGARLRLICEICIIHVIHVVCVEHVSWHFAYMCPRERPLGYIRVLSKLLLIPRTSLPIFPDALQNLPMTLSGSTEGFLANPVDTFQPRTASSASKGEQQRWLSGCSFASDQEFTYTLSHKTHMFTLARWLTRPLLQQRWLCAYHGTVRLAK